MVERKAVVHELKSLWLRGNGERMFVDCKSKGTWDNPD
jgi:hypothetical protein